MAILWQKRVDGTLYEVRTAGNTRRLYTDGVFHSQFNPRSPVTGGVWDLLTLPAFFYPAHAIRRVLLLGVGGGAVLRQLHCFLGPLQVVGVELNPVHLYVARRFFGVQRKGLELHEADAVQWVRDYDGPPFDMVIDDLFGAEEGEPIRAVAANARWFDAILRHLSPDGVFVANFLSPGELRRSGYCADARVRRRFSGAFQLTTPRHENAIGAFLRHDADGLTLRRNLSAVPELDVRRRGCRLRYRLRRLQQWLPCP